MCIMRCLGVLLSARAHSNRNRFPNVDWMGQPWVTLRQARPSRTVRQTAHMRLLSRAKNNAEGYGRELAC